MSSTFDSHELQNIYKRFGVLYPRILKNQQQSYKNNTQQASLTVIDQIKLCKSLAKSESLTLGEDEASIQTLAEIEKEVALTMQQSTLDFSKGMGSRELFTIFLYAYLQYRAKDPSRGFLTLIFELLNKAQQHIALKRQGGSSAGPKEEEQVAASEDIDISIEIDISIKNDEVLNSLLEVSASLVRKLVRLGDQPVVSLINSISAQIKQYLKLTNGQVFNLDTFAPTSIVYKLLDYLMRDKRLKQWGPLVHQAFETVLAQTFELFEVYKVNSKYFIITIHSSSNKANEEEKSIRRMSVLFTDLLDMLVGFCCQHLKTQSGNTTAQAVKLYHCLFSTQAKDTTEEYFTLRERLRILNELNFIFNQVPQIIMTEYYWGMIQNGLHEIDQYCRKVSMTLLKGNLKALGNEELYAHLLTKTEFELHWTTFFDLYDTLESFGTHLTKAVWERSEVFYVYIKKNYGVSGARNQLHPLLDFRAWLLVLYKRVQSHMNLKLRRYVQKSTLKRTYMTVHMGEYLFDEFLRSLNKGLLFKDANIYSQFSSKSQLVNAFYERYFTQECTDLMGDLARYFNAIVTHVSHPQLIICTFRILAKNYPQMRGEGVVKGFIGNNELEKIYDMTNSYFNEQVFSSRYLCQKYVMKALSYYLDVSQANLNYTLLLKLLGKMPLEFFSTKTLYQDKEGRDNSFALVQRLRNPIALFKGLLGDIFQVRAIAAGLHQFGKEINYVIEGLARLIIVADRHSEGSEVWLQIMDGNMEAFSQIMATPYLTPEVADSKVRYLSVLLKTAYKYGEDKLRHQIRCEYVSRGLPLVLERLETNLMVPLQKYEHIQHLPSELSKVHSLFLQLDPYYIDLLSLGINMCHMDLNQANSSLDTAVKSQLQVSLKIAQLAQTLSKQESTEGVSNTWIPYLLQYISSKTLTAIVGCYANGIRACLVNGVKYFLVSEDLMQFGQSILHALVDFRQVPRPPSATEGESLEQQQFLVENNLTLSLMQQEVLLNQWTALCHLLYVLSFDPEQRENVLHPLYPLISSKTVDFLGCSTKDYHPYLFKVLKDTYVPILLQRLATQQDTASELISEYQGVCMQVWGLIKELQTDFDPPTLLEFIEFAFHPEVMEYYAALARARHPAGQQIDFHSKLARDLFEQGNRYWLITRSALNHLMTLFTQRPHLLLGFEDLLVNFCVYSEVRSLDSEILLQKMDTLIPEVFPKAYERLNMEEVTYYGAYTRTVAMLVIEELIRRHKRLVGELQEGQLLGQLELEFIQGFENFIVKLFNFNFDKRLEKASMPYSEPHRFKVRIWQTLVIALDLLDPNTIYRLELRKQIREFTCRDIIQDVNKLLWKVVAQNHLATVRAYIEIVVIRFSLAHPLLTFQDPLFAKTLFDPNVKSTVASSLLVIAGFVMTKLSPEQLSHVPQGGQSIIQLKQELVEHMSGFLTSNGAHIRCIAQYFMHLASNDATIRPYLPLGLDHILTFLATNRDCQKVIKRHDEETKRVERVLNNAMGGAQVVLSTPIDEHGEFLSVPFVERIKEIISECMSIIRNVHDAGFYPVKRESLWKEELKERLDRQGPDMALSVNEASQSNYQRKILPWEQVEYDHELLKRVYEGRKRNDIIMCAALIDKVPNLAGLARTSEIMNARCLVINNRAVCETEEFKGVSVTSEKWLPIYEVPEKDLFNYLLFQKSNGYKILGLEQTANSKMLHEYKFPHKCVMLLGKEKEGIPQMYLSILDECIEIPQFGIIRSLNVHVSGALCLWEYTKQHLPASNSSQRQ